MAFTIVIEEGQTVPAIVCDWCEQPAGLDGQVLWGRQVDDINGQPTAVTSVCDNIPFTAFVACGLVCGSELVMLHGERLSEEWMSVRTFLFDLASRD